jgi:hypothetical protein
LSKLHPTYREDLKYLISKTDKLLLKMPCRKSLTEKINICKCALGKRQNNKDIKKIKWEQTEKQFGFLSTSV